MSTAENSSREWSSFQVAEQLVESSPVVADVLDRIASLYAINDEIRSLSADLHGARGS